MRYEVTWEQDGVVMTMHGRVTEDQRQKAHDSIINDTRFDRIRYWIIDTLDIDAYELDEKSALKAAGCDIGASHINAHVLMAFVTINMKQMENIERFQDYLSQVNSPWRVEIFSNQDAARRWIANTRAKGTKAKTAPERAACT